MSFEDNQLILVQSEQLQPGMYVAELDKSWRHTPFHHRGFVIEDAAQLELLQTCCDHVYVDPGKSTAGLFPEDGLVNTPPENEVYSVGIPHQLNGAREALGDVVALVAATVRAARKTGRIDIGPINRQVDILLEHVLTSPDAIQWLLATETTRGLLNRRALGTSVLSIVFGRHMGFDQQELHNLALGGLLLDIGKTSVPVPILAKPGHLNSAERTFVNRHVTDGLSMIRSNSDVMERVIDMVSAHHERIDGSGYPHKIAGTEIPLFARMAGIVDTFDALTLNRNYASARSGHSALRFLDALRDIKFDSALVDEFIRAVGVYPTGTCVELIDRSVGLVCSQNAGLPKNPNVLLTTDSTGQALGTMLILEPADNIRIARALPATSLASDPRFLNR
jgi:hypothetical protein